MVVHYFWGLWYHEHIKSSGVKFILSFILSLFYFLTVFISFPFCLCLWHRQIMPPPQFGKAWKIIQPCHPPTAKWGQCDDNDVPFHLQPLHQPLCLHILILHFSPTPPTNTLPPRLWGYFSEINSEWHQKCLFLFIIIIHFLFTYPQRKCKQV